MRLFFSSLALATALAAAAPAQAVDVGSGIDISGNAAVTTDYRFRGVSFSDEDIAIQGGIDIGHESGFYVGIWGSSLEEDADEVLLFGTPTATSPSIFKTGNFGHTEIDVYIGWSGEVSSGVEVDVGVLYYLYPNARNRTPVIGPCTPATLDCSTADGILVGTTDFDTDYIEPYASVSYSIGPAQLTTGVAWAPSQSALGNDDNWYLYGDASVGIPNTPITLNGHIGYTNGSLSVDTDDDYVDWSLGIDVVFGPMTLGIAYVDTNAPSGPGVDSTVVGTIGVEF